jgi:TusA-related sulfurtransferase
VKTASNYINLKIRVDQLADARGIIFTDKLKFVESALESLDHDEILCIYCSDQHHKSEIPNWIKERGHVFLGIIEKPNYFKILIKKN